MNKKIFFIVILFLTTTLLFNSCTPVEHPSPTEQDRIHRIILVGIGKYKYIDDIGSGIPNQEFVDSILSQWKFGRKKKGFEKIAYLYNEEATKANIINTIKKEFGAAKEEDVSYFFFGGHGGYSNGESYLCPYDCKSSAKSSIITTGELKNVFDSIEGTKVLIFDSCNCGGFIGKGDNHCLENFVEIFKDEKKGSTTLTGENYKVLVSCRSNEICQTYGYNGLLSGVFTYALIKGASDDFPADVNRDSVITLQEMYNYIKGQVASLGYSQEIQVYPENDNFPIVEY